ncbi:hypothetical protein [Nocardia sp. BMG111209]|uniref:hypothetical protein n=1 Tax=Nocardia sp. BMG111209 TaxID=1160137 RepID=UPI00037F5252|nr:hypothetical protein [Nocardia sp. BMG111209]
MASGRLNLVRFSAFLVALVVAAVLGAGTAVQAQAPAPPPIDPACATLPQRALAHNDAAEAHNSQEAGIDHTDAGVVTSFNNVSKQLNDEKATLEQERASCVTAIQQAQAATRATAPGKPVPVSKGPRGPPSKSETVNASLADKAKDPTYVYRYYDNAGPNGEKRRRNPNEVDLNGKPVPVLRQDAADPTQYFPVPDTAIPPQFVSGSRDRQNASLPQWVGVAEQMSARSMATMMVNTWEAQEHREIAATGAVSPQTAAALDAVYTAQTKAGEQVGLYAGQQFLDTAYPVARYDRSPSLTDPANDKSGTFDGVYEITDKATGAKKILILEAKSPNSALGSRKGAQNENCKQGSRCYYDSIVLALTNSTSAIERDLGFRLSTTPDSDIEYILVRAMVAEEQRDGVTDQRYDGYRSEQFDLTR